MLNHSKRPYDPLRMAPSDGKKLPFGTDASANHV